MSYFNEIKEAAGAPMESRELQKSLSWLIRTRWAAVLGVLIVTHVLREMSVLSFSLIPVYFILGTAVLCNLFYLTRVKYPTENFRRLAFVQILVDQVLLALAVYFSGGCDSPFIYFFIFHVIISGTILPWHYAVGFAGTAILFPMLVLGLKHVGILRHYGIFRHESMLFKDYTIISSYGLAFITTIFLTAYFVTYLSKRLHEKSREVIRLYSISERLRSSIRLREVISVIEEELRGVVGADSSAYLPLDKELRVLAMSVNGRTMTIPLVDKNSISDAVLRGVPNRVDGRLLTSDYDLKALDMLGVRRCIVLPVMAASMRPCFEVFQCSDTGCNAYNNNGPGRCWQLSGTHCKGTVIRNNHDKMMLCTKCELFTPAGAIILSLPGDNKPEEDSAMDVSMRLLDTAGLAISNALLYEKTIVLSKTDGLTGLLNHREFKESIEAEILRSKRYRRSFSLFMIDVDYFKHYNDTNGHPQGDILLKKMAELIQDNFKDTDIVARYGGEEFGVLLLEPDDKEQAFATAERLRNMVDWCKFPKEESQPNGTITVSVGVSCYPEDGETMEEIIRAADAALYLAKKEGRNRVVSAGYPAAPCQ